MARLASAALVILAVAVSGCVTAQAKADPAAGPALSPPAPPPHTIIPVEIAPEPAAAPLGPAPVVVKPAAKPPAVKPDKPAEKPAEKSDAPGIAPPPSPPPAPSPQLQTTANVTEAEKRIRARMAQASWDLDHTDYRALTAERRAQYDTAKRFIQQAEDALRVRNVVFAEQLADKAATLAAALVQK
jgi:hypothetical protein